MTRVIGLWGLKVFDRSDVPIDGEIETGWRLHELARGQGYALEAATASLEWG